VKGTEVKRCLIRLGISVGAVRRRRYFPIQLVHDSCGETMEWGVKLEKKDGRLVAESLVAHCPKCRNVTVPLEILQELTAPPEVARRLAQIREMEQRGEEADREIQINAFHFTKAMERILGQTVSV